jgi:phage portal protein BeeE
MKVEKISQTPDEAQFNGTREQLQTFICSLFPVPPHMIGDQRAAGGKTNLEQIGGEFVTFTLNPWLKALTQEAGRKLFPRTSGQPQMFFPHFDVKPLIMPDAATRKDYYSSGKQWGYQSTDDILESEGQNPTDQPGSDKYWMPVNMGIMTDEGAQIPTSPDSITPDDPNAPDPVKKAKRQRLARMLKAIYELEELAP